MNCPDHYKGMGIPAAVTRYLKHLTRLEIISSSWRAETNFREGMAERRWLSSVASMGIRGIGRGDSRREPIPLHRAVAHEQKGSLLRLPVGERA